LTYCSKCGREAKEEDKYCTKCGSQLVEPTLPEPTYETSKDGSVVTGQVGDLRILCFRTSHDRRRKSQFKLLVEEEEPSKKDEWTAIIWDGALRDPSAHSRQEERKKRGMELAEQLIADATILDQEEILLSRQSGYVVSSTNSRVSCPHCGEDLKEGSRFCIHCGKLLSEPPEKPLEPAEPPEITVPEPGK